MYFMIIGAICRSAFIRRYLMDRESGSAEIDYVISVHNSHPMRTRLGCETGPLPDITVLAVNVG
jgi:hypothetical protein